MKHNNLILKHFAVLFAVLFFFVQGADCQTIESVETENAINPLQSQIDSILNLVSLQDNDEEKAKLYNAIVHLPAMSTEGMIKYAQLSLEHCPKNNLELVADNYNLISYSYNNLAKPNEALEYSRPLLELYKKLNLPKRIAIVYERIANSYEYLQKPDSVFHYLNKSLQVYENLNDTLYIAETYFDIAARYNNLSFYKSGEEYFRKALAMDSAIGNLKGIARDYYGLANSVSEGCSTNYLSSIHYLKKSADLFESATIDDSDIQYLIYKYMSFSALSLSYIQYADEGGKAYADSCRLYQDKVGSFFEDFGFEGMVWHKQYTYVMYLVFYQKYDEALAIMLDLEKRIENGELDREASSFYEQLYNLYVKKGDYRNACDAQRKHYERKMAEVNDSVLASAANAKTEQALIYERKITDAEKSRMRVVIFSLIGGLFLVSLLVFYIFRVLKIKKKANAELSVKNNLLAEQNDLLAEQKEEIEAQRDTIKAQSDEIQDSINYAQRIQRSLLTPDETITRIFPDHFLLYKPRNVVSGDYYWIGQFGDNKVCIVADCTGHGVPGGFLSVLGMSNLNYIVNQNISPDVILNHLRESIITNLRQENNEPTAPNDMAAMFESLNRSRDGMDVAAYVVNEKQMKLSYAGANNPLILIRGSEMQVLKADRMPVGIYTRIDPFRCTTIDIQHGDCLYTFSDGFQDQFGYNSNRKFMGKRLRELLLEIHELPMAEQKKILNLTYEEWRGPAENQTDDVVIMGVRI